MDIKNIQIARKYASAFLNIYFNKIDEKAFLNIISTFEFLKNNRNLLQFLSLPNLEINDKKEIINYLFRKFDLPLEFSKLTNLLLLNNRLFLFIDILRELIFVYQDMASILIFNIKSADLLQDSGLKTIRHFLENKSQKKIIERYTIDKNLIAGIRAISKNYLWEYSIKAKLQSIERLLEQER